MSRRWQAIWLTVATAASLTGVAFGAVAAIMSPLVFDGPGNIMNPVAWVAFLLIVGLWVVCLLAPCGAWVAFFRKKTGLTWLAMGAPVLWLIALSATWPFVPT